MKMDAIESKVSNMPNNALPEHLVKIWLKVLKKYTWQLTVKSAPPGWEASPLRDYITCM